MAQRDHRSMTTVRAPVFRLERLNLTVPQQMQMLACPGHRHIGDAMPPRNFLRISMPAQVERDDTEGASKWRGILPEKVAGAAPARDQQHGPAGANILVGYFQSLVRMVPVTGR